MKKHTLFLTLLIPVIVLLTPALANAGTTGLTGPRTITSIGCNNDNSGICYVSLDATVGPDACPSDSVRWLTTTGDGKSQLSLLMAAFVAGKQVNLFITNNCFTPQPQYPTFAYSFIYK